MPRYKQRTPGTAPKYNRDEILRGFRLGLSNITIAQVVGCTPGYVGEIRNREKRRKRLFCEGRVC